MDEDNEESASKRVPTAGIPAESPQARQCRCNHARPLFAASHCVSANQAQREFVVRNLGRRGIYL